MTIIIDRSKDRGHADLGWLKTHYSFSFSDYMNPARMGFGALRVLNDDWIAPGAGFGTHPHKDTEIVTIVLEGALAHKDSTGGEGVIRPGEVQVMSAGTGIRHSEFNASQTEPVALLQIWITPSTRNLKPRYDQKKIELKQNTRNLLVGGKEHHAPLLISQNATISRAIFDGGKSIDFDLKPKRGLFVFVIKGALSVAGRELQERDALMIQNEKNIQLVCKKASDVLMIEVDVT